MCLEVDDSGVLGRRGAKSLTFSLCSLPLPCIYLELEPSYIFPRVFIVIFLGGGNREFFFPLCFLSLGIWGALYFPPHPA